MILAGVLLPGPARAQTSRAVLYASAGAELTQYDVDAWAIPAKSPYIELAHEFIKYASDARRQADFTNIFAYGTTINGAEKFIKPERIALLPAGDNLKTGLHIGSEEARAFWLDHLEELNERFNTWSGTSE